MRTALLAALLLCGALPLAACDEGSAAKEEASGSGKQPPAAMTSAEREQQLEKARQEAQAILAARNANRQPVTATNVRSAGRVLANAEASPEALSRAFLRALARQDVQAIQRLRVTKEEFCEHLFPELPASRLANVTCDFTWEQATLKSLGGLDKTYPRHRGKQYELVAVRFAKGTESYATYRVHKKTLLTVRDASGQEQEIQLFGSMLEMDGRYKLFSFVAD